MNIKRIFGSLLIMLGTASIIYTALLFINNQGGDKNIRTISMYGIFGLLFFLSGLSFFRDTNDES
jgi:hypothetical protein